MATPTQDVFWLHHACLRLPHGIDTQNLRAIFIWDDELLRRQGYSLKRLVFLYETLCELPVDIIKGDAIQILASYDRAVISTWQTDDAEIIAMIAALEQRDCNISVLKQTPFIAGEKGVKLNRFFQYWNKVQKKALLVNGGGSV